MIDFEEEVKKFQPRMEVREAEDAIHHSDLTDLTDLLREMSRAGGNPSGRAGAAGGFAPGAEG